MSVLRQSALPPHVGQAFLPVRVLLVETGQTRMSVLLDSSSTPRIGEKRCVIYAY
jgi:hypothetical protein